MTTVHALYPIYCSDSGVGHTCLSLCQAMRGPDFDVPLDRSGDGAGDRRDFVRDVVPHCAATLSCRKPSAMACGTGAPSGSLFGSFGRVTSRTSGRACRPWVYEAIKARGNTLVMERINCHRATSRRILDEAYDRLGWPPAHGITRRRTSPRSSANSTLADYVFCPSPFVVASPCSTPA